MVQKSTHAFGTNVKPTCSDACLFSLAGGTDDCQVYTHAGGTDAADLH